MLRFITLAIVLLIASSAVFGRVRISGGSDAKPHQYPFYGGITASGLDKIICSGFFYKEDIFVSLANCQGIKYQVTDLLVYAGGNDRRCWDENVHCAVFQVVKTITHPQYSAKTLSNDIGVYLLKENITTTIQKHPNDTVKVSTIGIPDTTPPLNETAHGYLMGWGRLNVSATAGPYNLQSAEQAIIDDSYCNKADTAGKYQSDLMRCVNGTHGRGCMGDGGSALVIETENGMQAAAMFSFSLGNTDNICEEGTLHAYLNLVKYKKWIDQTVETLNGSPSLLPATYLVLLIVSLMAFVL